MDKVRQLLNVTSGREDAPAVENSSVTGYLLLIKLEEVTDESRAVTAWPGPVLNVDLTAETTIALIHIEVEFCVYI